MLFFLCVVLAAVSVVSGAEIMLTFCNSNYNISTASCMSELAESAKVTGLASLMLISARSHTT
jgi:hypothetical protein